MIFIPLFLLGWLLSPVLPIIIYWVRSKQFIIPESSSSFLHPDPVFIEWTSQFMPEGLLDEKHWFLQYPGYLIGCCPQVKSMNDDPLLLTQLSRITPAHAFAYVLTRKLAEAAVQFFACWLPIGLLVMTAYSGKNWLIARKKNESENSSEDTNQSFCSLKRTYMLSLVPLSILLPYLAELVFGGVLDYQKQMIRGNRVEDSNFRLLYLQWREMLSKSETPSFVHLFNFIKLHRSLYGDYKLSPDATIFSQQTELSLSYWSVLAFVGLIYVAVALAFRALIWQPVKKLCSLLTKDKLTQIYSLKEYKEKMPFPAEEVDIFQERSSVVHQPRIRKSSSFSSFSTDSEKENNPSQLSDKLLKHFDTYTYPDPESLFSKKDSQTSTSTAAKKGKKQRSSRPAEPGEGLCEECAHSSRVVSARKLPVRPRYVSRGTFADLDNE